MFDSPMAQALLLSLSLSLSLLPFSFRWRPFKTARKSRALLRVPGLSFLPVPLFTAKVSLSRNRQTQLSIITHKGAHDMEKRRGSKSKQAIANYYVRG